MNAHETWEQLHKTVQKVHDAIGTTGRFSAYIGKPGGSNPVADATRRRIYYMTGQGDYGEAVLDAGSGIPLQAVTALNGRAVWLAYPPGESRDGGVPHVMGLALEGMLIAGGMTPQEQIMNASIFPSAEQLTTLRASPTNPPTTSALVQGEWIYKNPATGDLNDLPTSTAEAGSLIAALTAGQHQLVALCADPTQTDDALKLVYVSNAALTAAGALPARTEFSIADILTLPVDSYVPISAIYLYYGQTSLEEADFYRQFPLRPLFQPVNASNYQTLQVDGSVQTGRPILDLIAGANLTLTPSDDAPGTRSKVTIAASAGTGGSASPATCEGRLTLESGVPVSTSDQTAKTTLYFTPFRGNYVGTYSGSVWSVNAFTEKSLDISGFTANKNYDIFIVDSTLVLEGLVWTNDTTRATALALQDGIYVKSGAATRRYLGTIRITETTGQCEDSQARRFVWNAYNRVPRHQYHADTTASWTYATSAWHPSHASSANQVACVIGLAEDACSYDFSQRLSQNGSGNGFIAIGIDSATTPSSPAGSGGASSAAALSVVTLLHTILEIGYHTITMLENRSGSVTVTFYGGGIGDLSVSCLQGEILA